MLKILSGITAGALSCSFVSSAALLNIQAVDVINNLNTKLAPEYKTTSAFWGVSRVSLIDYDVKANTNYASVKFKTRITITTSQTRVVLGLKQTSVYTQGFDGLITVATDFSQLTKEDVVYTTDGVYIRLPKPTVIKAEIVPQKPVEAVEREILSPTFTEELQQEVEVKVKEHLEKFTCKAKLDSIAVQLIQDYVLNTVRQNFKGSVYVETEPGSLCQLDGVLT